MPLLKPDNIATRDRRAVEVFHPIVVELSEVIANGVDSVKKYSGIGVPEMREKVWDFMSRVLNASEKVRPLIKESVDMPSNQLKTILNCVDMVTGENTATKINQDTFKAKINTISSPDSIAQQAEKMNKKTSRQKCDR